MVALSIKIRNFTHLNLHKSSNIYMKHFQYQLQYNCFLSYHFSHKRIICLL